MSLCTGYIITPGHLGQVISRVCPLLSPSILSRNSTELSLRNDLQRLSFDFRRSINPALPCCKCMNSHWLTTARSAKGLTITHAARKCLYSVMVHPVLPTYLWDGTGHGGLPPLPLTVMSLISHHRPFSITQFKQSEMCNHKPVWSEECASVCYRNFCFMFTDPNQSSLANWKRWSLKSGKLVWFFFSLLLKSLCFPWVKRGWVLTFSQ